MTTHTVAHKVEEGVQVMKDGGGSVTVKTRIIRNAIVCTQCRQEIESTHVHDFRMCRCGKCGVDGGKDYLRRIGSDWQDTSVVIEEPGEYKLQP